MRGLCILAVVAVASALPTSVDIQRGPFMCNHKKGSNLLDVFLLQTGTGCRLGEDCDTTPPYKDDDLRKANWTAPEVASRHKMQCSDCGAAVRSLNDFCRSNQGRARDLALDFMQICANLRPHDRGMAAVCLGVYETAADMFCPMDPCMHVLTSLQFDEHATAICGSAALDCDGSGDDEPPEKSLYAAHTRDYQPRWTIPPLSCSKYIAQFQKQCQNPSLPQWQYCDKLEGHPKTGCLRMVQVLLRVPSMLGTDDVCQPLFAQTATASLERKPIDPVDVCVTTLGFPDQSPLPIEEWLASKKKFDAIKITPTPTPEAEATPIATATPTASLEPPCIDAPTPTPIPRGIVQLFEHPVGYRPVMQQLNRIPFECDVTSLWADVRPSLGCHFSEFSVKTAGFGDPTRTEYPCSCTCSGRVDKCGHEGQQLFWSDVRSPTDCAQMMCHSNQFAECKWNDKVVGELATWNGDHVTFNSVALQETCRDAQPMIKNGDWKAATASLEDFCGVVVDGSTTVDVSRLLRWSIETADGAMLGDSGLAPSTVGATSTLGVHSVWLPCGSYRITLRDSSFEGHGWDSTELVLKDKRGFVMHRAGRTMGGDAHLNTQEFTISADSIRASRDGLCLDCDNDLPMPCKILVKDSASQCVPFMHGTSECPPGAVRC